LSRQIRPDPDAAIENAGINVDNTEEEIAKELDLTDPDRRIEEQGQEEMKAEKDEVAANAQADQTVSSPNSNPSENTQTTAPAPDALPATAPTAIPPGPQLIGVVLPGPPTGPYGNPFTQPYPVDVYPTAPPNPSNPFNVGLTPYPIPNFAPNPFLVSAFEAPPFHLNQQSPPFVYLIQNVPAHNSVDVNTRIEDHGNNEKKPNADTENDDGGVFDTFLTTAATIAAAQLAGEVFGRPVVAPGYVAPGYVAPGYVAPYGSQGYGYQGYGNSGFGTHGYGSNGLGSTALGSQGYGNSLYGNGGYGNPGYGNAGYGNGGYGNGGYGNTGFGNGGYGNGGFGNGGYGNGGYGNGGFGNGGYGNTGFGNGGFGNGGYGNGGYGNGGYGNLGGGYVNNGLSNYNRPSHHHHDQTDFRTGLPLVENRGLIITVPVPVMASIDQTSDIPVEAKCSEEPTLDDLADRQRTDLTESATGSF